MAKIPPMENHITRRHALALTGAAFAASCTDNKEISVQTESLPRQDLFGTWSSGVPLPFPVQEIYPCAHDGAIHLAGGFVAENGRITGPTNTYSVFTQPDHDTAHLPTPGSWFRGDSEYLQNPSRLPAARHHPHMVSFGGQLLIFAGFESPSQNAIWTMQSSGWVFSYLLVRVGPAFYWPSSGQFEMPSLPIPCAEAVVGVTGDDTLHLAGGRTPKGEANANWNDHIDTDHHFVLTSLDGQWETAAPCLTKRNSAAGDVINGNLHVVGGRTVGGGNVATHEVYDHVEDRWRTAAPMPQAQGGLAAASVTGKLYVFGGEYFDNGGGVYSESWVYDASTDTWSALPDMPNPRHGLGAVALDGKIYVIGGALQASGVDTSALVDVFTLA